jgi:hypothetical protein
MTNDVITDPRVIAEVQNQVIAFLNNPETWVKYRRNVRVNDGCIKVTRRQLVQHVLHNVRNVTYHAVHMIITVMIKRKADSITRLGFTITATEGNRGRLAYIICRELKVPSLGLSTPDLSTENLKNPQVVR